VSFSAEEARVRFDPGLVTVDELIAAVNQAGFRASLKRVEGPE
jgi:copper chaperone CopZ